jgi:hypothetical protein
MLHHWRQFPGQISGGSDAHQTPWCALEEVFFRILEGGFLREATGRAGDVGVRRGVFSTTPACAWRASSHDARVCWRGKDFVFLSVGGEGVRE